MPTPLISPLLLGIGTRMLKIGCSGTEINENKMYKSTFLLGHPLDIFTDQCILNTSTHEDICDTKKPIDEEDQKPIRRIQSNVPTSHTNGGDIFPRKVKSKLMKIKPALWEKNEEKLKNNSFEEGEKENKAWLIFC